MLRPGTHTNSIFKTQPVATHRNRVAKRAQHVAPNNSCDMMRTNVAIISPELANVGPTMLGYVVLKRCDRLAGT